MAIPTFNAGEVLTAAGLNTALSDTAAEAEDNAVSAVNANANTFSEPQTFGAAITQTPGAGADNSTPLAQYGDLFSDAIVSGLTTTTSSSLTGTLAAGVAYVLGQRVVYPGGNYTVAASSTSYLDLSDTGVLTVSTSSTVTPNSLRLWSVTSSATAITGVAQVAVSGIVANEPVSGPSGTSGNQFVNYTQLTNGSLDATLDNMQVNGNLTINGTSTAPTEAVGTNNTQLATTAFVQSAATAAAQNAFGNVVNAGNSGTAITLNVGTSSSQILTLTGDCTLSLDGIPSGVQGASLILTLIQGSGAPFTVTWPTGSLFPGGTAPTLSTAAGGVDAISMFTQNAGANWSIAPFGIGMAS